MPVTTTVKLDLDRDSTFATTISQYLISASVRQGRQKSLDPMEPATAIIKLNNSDGRFSPSNAASPYYPDFNDDGCGIRIEAGTRRFTGYITKIEQDPFIQNREVTLHCVDRLGYLAEDVISAGRFRLQPVHLILNRLIDILEGGEEIDNPGGEDLNADGSGDTTGYSAAASGTTIDSISTISFEGDYCIQAVCDGSVSGQGIRYDLGAEGSSYKVLALLARTVPGDGDVTLTVRGLNASLVQEWTTSIAVVESAWTHKQFFTVPPLIGHRYIEIITQSAVALTILLDGLHQAPLNSLIERSVDTDLDAIVEYLGLYDAPALEALQRLVATEAAGFLYMRTFNAGYGSIYASAQTVRDDKTTPSATFGDDGVNVPYVGLSFSLDAKERISQAQVRSGGSYEDTGGEAEIWELSPTGQIVPASDSLIFHAHYAQLARNCALAVNPNGTPTSYPIAASGDDGIIYFWEAVHPPDENGTVNTGSQYINVGQRKSQPSGTYFVSRAYVRFDTSGIDDGATVASSKLRFKLKSNEADTPFTIQVRLKAWGDTLAVGDWDGTGDIVGTFDTADLPPVGEFIEIDIDPTAINKTGYTEFEIMSSREATAPTAYETVAFSSYDGTDPPELHVIPQGATPGSIVFKNYGVGAEIEIGAGGEDLVIDQMYVTGIPLAACSEESLVIANATTPPTIPRRLPVEMPYQGTRTPDMVAEAGRLAERHSGDVRRLTLLLQEEDAASLSQMQVRELDDLIRLINTKWTFSTGIDANFFIEGMTWEVKDQGRVLELTLDLEEK